MEIMEFSPKFAVDKFYIKGRSFIGRPFYLGKAKDIVNNEKI
jgi:hypothetical protein